MLVEINRRAIGLLAACAVLAGTPDAALAWAAGTHVYIAKHTSKKAGLTTQNEMCNRMFGANAVDMFNTVFTDQGQRLAGALHDPARLVPLAPWQMASGDVQVAFAYGFASHNNTWGTDYVAHYSGITFGKDQGYIIAKAQLLRALLRPYIPPEIRPLLSEDALLLVAHILTEYGVDLQLARLDPSLGYDVMASTGCEDPVGVDFLVSSLGPALASDAGGELPAAAAIVNALQHFLPELSATGFALGLPTPVAIQAIAQSAAASAEGLLRLPPHALDPIRPQLIALCAAGIQGGMALTQADFLDEIEATIGRVNGKMSSLGISP
jgi:hypothetical protein